MSKAIAIFNQKGGVGKTTTNINLAACLAHMGKKVLMVDIDPQGNTTSGIGIKKRKLKVTLYDALIDSSLDVSKVILPTNTENLFLLPASVDLAGAEVELATLEGRERKLKRIIDEVKHDYDYILVDCPPSLGILTLNSLTAVDSVLIPIQCEFYALEGVSQLISTIEMVKKRLNPNLYIDGVILSMFDGRTNLSQAVVEDVRNFFGKAMYNTIIPRNVRLAEAPSYGVSIITYDPTAPGAKAYQEFTKEFLAREKTRKSEK
ncbi:MAG: ParA family protein [Synergistaceae bacterium]|nr:ParA family protein [Synergistaceae bacterium]NLY87323.1 ParA family protein [Clostridiales bacterium]